MQVLDTKALPRQVLCGEAGRPSRVVEVESAEGRIRVPGVINSFWPSRQRGGHSLHEVSYRACFKPELPRFFIEQFTDKGDGVLDCFMGRGTTVLEAALTGRVGWGNDANPMCREMLLPRLNPPRQSEVEERLKAYSWRYRGRLPEGLSVFFHEGTLREICFLRKRFLQAEATGAGPDRVDAWIRMVAANRLTGHSPGFFSVYTLPPNQAVSIEAQRRINAKRKQVPPRRRVPERIAQKSKALLRDVEAAKPWCPEGWRKRVFSGDASRLEGIADESVDLVVTSPPFLDTVNYGADNWLRGWFYGVDLEPLALGGERSPDDWSRLMGRVFTALRRVLRPGGKIAFEVGEIRGGRLDLERRVLDLGAQAGLRPEWVLYHQQKFTKTAHCWGIRNGDRGTNSQRVVVFEKTA